MLTIQAIREKMNESKVWNHLKNGFIYPGHEFTILFAEHLTPEVAQAISQKVRKVQYYFDQRIIEPK
jgi:hypothetical protein